MISHLSKDHYLKSKNIPTLAPLSPLDPEPPVRTHLLEPFPTISTELEKLLSTRKEHSVISLELANSHKIIHELEEEIELLLEKNSCLEEKMLEGKSESRKLLEINDRLNEQVNRLELSLSTTDYQWRSKYEMERERLLRILSQYEKEVENRSTNVVEIQRNHGLETQKAQKHYQRLIEDLRSKKMEAEAEYQVDIKAVSDQLANLVEENGKLKKQLCELEDCNTDYLLSKERKIGELTQQLHDIKTQLEYEHFSLSGQVELLSKKLKESEEIRNLQSEQHERARCLWEDDVERNKRQKEDLDERWKENYEGLLRSKQKLALDLSNSSQKHAEKDILISNYASDLKRMQDRIDEIEAQSQRIMAARDEQIGQIREEQSRKQQELKATWEQEAQKRSIESNQNLYEQYEANRVQLCASYEERIKAIEDRMGRKIKETENEALCLLEQNGRLKAELVAVTGRETELFFEKQSLLADYEQKVKELNSVWAKKMETIKCEMEAEKSQAKKELDSSNQKAEAKEKQLQRKQIDLTDCLQQLENERRNFMEVIRSHEIKIISLTKEKERTLNSLIESESALKSREESHRHQSTQYDNQIAELQKMIATYQKNTQQSEQKYFEETSLLRKRLEEFDGSLRRKEMQAKSLQDQIVEEKAKAEEDLKQRIEQIGFLKKKISSLEHQFMEKDSNMERHVQELLEESEKRYIDRLQRKDVSICDLESKVSQMRKELQQYELDLTKTSNALEEERKRVKYQSQTMLSKIEQLEMANEKLNQENEAHSGAQLKAELLAEKVGVLEHSLKEKEKKRAELEALVEEKQQEIHNQNEKMGRYELTIREIRQKYEQQTTRILHLKEESAKKDKESSLKIEELSREVVSTRHQLRKKLELSEIQVSNSMLRVETTQEELTRFKESCLALEAQLSSLKIDHQSLKVRLEGAMSELNESRSIVNQKSQNFEIQLRDKDSTISSLQFKVKQLEQQLSFKIQEVASLKTVIEESRAKFDNERRAVYSLREQMDEAIEERDRVKRSLDKKDKAFEQERKRFERQFNKQIQESDLRVAEAIKDIEEKMEIKNKEKVAELSSCKKKIQSLESEVMEVRRRTEQTFFEEKEKLYLEINYKEKQVIELSLNYETLEKDYNELVEEITYLKKKLGTVFNEIRDCNTDATPSSRHFRTECKQSRKIVTSEMRKQARALTSTRREQHVERGETFHSEFNFSREVFPIKKHITTIMGGDSSVVNSRVLNEMNEGSNVEQEKERSIVLGSMIRSTESRQKE